MGETLERRENIASPGTRGKSVGVVLAKAKYIIRPRSWLPAQLKASIQAIHSRPKKISETIPRTGELTERFTKLLTALCRVLPAGLKF